MTQSYFRIGAALGGAGEFDLYENTLAFLNINDPTLAEYFPYSTVQGRADYSQTRRGPAYAQMMWDTLDHREYEELRTMVVEGRTNNLFYFTIDLVDKATYPLGTWADISGAPQILVATPRANSNGHWYDDVVLEIRNTTIVNNPALNL